MKIVKVENLVKRFKNKVVLDNVSFEVEEGEIFGFIGPNGAGKSTLLNIMTGLLSADKGEISICGFNIEKEDLKAKACMGYVPQDLALIENISAYDNLEYFGALYGLKGKELKEEIKNALEITGLLDKKKEKVKKFSGGMKRRLNIAAAIMHKPKVLILDEPTVGVDPQSRNHIFSFIKKVSKERGTTIIYTSHYMEEVEELCERVFIMDLGKEVAYGNKRELKEAVLSKSKIEIECENLSEDSIIKIKEIEGISKVEKNNNKIILSVANDFKISKTLNLLDSDNVTINKINYEEQKLEEIFLSLTGKSLRD